MLFAVTSSFVGFVKTKVPPIPTAARDIRRLVNDGFLGSTDTLVDLGCNNGKVLFTMEKLSGCKARGYEITLWVCIYGWIKKFLTRSKAKIIWGDFFDADLSDATVVYCYLYPFLMPRVGEKLKSSCKKGTKVIARDFPIKSLNQASHFKTYGVHEFFIYEI